jgi:hypothetical protein
MTIHKIDSLVGVYLDAAVAKAEGIAFRICNSAEGKFLRTGVAGSAEHYPCTDLCVEGYRPSSHWGDGGAIIERERIAIEPNAGTKTWSAVYNDSFSGNWPPNDIVDADTPLVAAMRAYLAAKFGETVELPA